MKASTKDELKGTLFEVTGKVKEKAGQIMSNRDLEAKGKAERKTGKVKTKGRADRKSVREVNEVGIHRRTEVL